MILCPLNKYTSHEPLNESSSLKLPYLIFQLLVFECQSVCREDNWRQAILDSLIPTGTKMFTSCVQNLNKPKQQKNEQKICFKLAIFHLNISGQV